MEKFVYAVAVLAVISSSALADLDLSNVNVNDLQQQLPAEFANPNETINHARTMFKEKCIKVAGEEKGAEAYTAIEMGIMQLGECATNIVNVTVIQKEIDLASPKGELDVVFNKYCNKRPEAVKCVEEFNEKLVPCLEEDERENQVVFMRIVNSLLNFICHKGGDQIALFIAEKGPECLESKKDDIQQCLNSTFSHYIPKEGIENVKTLPKFVMGEKQCEDIQKLETCIVDKLESCSEITPANIVESMFRFIKNETICRNKPISARQLHGANGGAYSASSFNIMTLLVSSSLFYTLTKMLQ